MADFGFLVTDRNGNIRYATAKARKLMRLYFHQQSELALPDPIRTWLKPLEKLGLTKREAQVLFWASQGKSNGEIAIILASKVQTIAKHLERIFAKLMVENRTAAARAAFTTVNPLSR